MASQAGPSSSLQTPDKIGPLFFCSSCGSLLDVPKDEDVIACVPCGAHLDASVYDNLSLVTRSNPSAFPSALRTKRQLVSTVSSRNDGGDGARADEATIREKCPKCGNEEMRFSTLQMRSADEGTTVFYTCPNCGYKFSQNN
ncbi:hypothetical protein BDZ90DRAFT_233342 [Jaminaea rosea]|uniref:DNA-directed RNA polymerase subunit n=1 Tax=Jaminaea rosea TaxID=1569628 RepID=A0A316UN26_9BASI|nr:hypothetical protein BDZ90DRAFT_233342 [Jaminaea rosea]PWN26208.1 hypothetical protein BDZ90DRAFT_233342 [Jaminaea rosea]